MRKALLVAVALMMCGSYAVAQDYAKAELGAGWNYLHVDSDVLPTQNSIPGGFFVDGTYYFTKLIGLTGDFQYGSKTFSTDAVFTSGDSMRALSFHAGPRVKARMGKFEPFAHALFGFTNLNLNPAGSAPGTPAQSANEFSFKLGGGVDYALTHRFAVRLGEFNYYRTQFKATDFAGVGGFPSGLLPSSQNNFTFGVGIVIR